MRGQAGSVLVTLLVFALLGCTAADSERPPAPAESRPGSATAASASATPTGSSSSGHSAPSTATPSSPDSPTSRSSPAEAASFDSGATLRTIEHLAGEIGPREGSSKEYRRAAAFVERRLERLGYDVNRERVPVPAGDSWGVPVPAGQSRNVIADPPGFESDEPYVIIGAHLDTVPQAPGAEDNASGVAVLLELAEMIIQEPPPTQVRLIAFGAEEPRGPGDDLHHFGSRVHVDNLSGAEQKLITAMVSLDRVGVRGSAVPVCYGGRGSASVRRSLVRVAGDIPTTTCENRSSDHWSFEKADIPAARLGSIPYDGYHSERDVPDVVDSRQLARVGRLTWSWLQAQ